MPCVSHFIHTTHAATDPRRAAIRCAHRSTQESEMKPKLVLTWLVLFAVILISVGCQTMPTFPRFGQSAGLPPQTE